MAQDNIRTTKETVPLGVHVRRTDKAAIKELAAASGVSVHRWMQLVIENAVKRNIRFRQQTRISIEEGKCS